MSKNLSHLLKSNVKWADKVVSKKPHFFQQKSKQSGCKYLWFGCSDSRVPATQLLGLGPGDIFVHRNVANQVNHEDLSSMVVLKTAIELQNVEDIIVCGHTGCLGVRLAIEKSEDPLLNKWLTPIADLYERKKEQCNGQSDGVLYDHLAQLNVEQQVKQIARHSAVQKAWSEGRVLGVHGLMYSLETGTLRDLNISVYSN